MRIRAGFNIAYHCPALTPMLLSLEIHPSRRGDLLTDHTIRFDPPLEARAYTDSFGNICTRIEAPAGEIAMSTLFEIHDSGDPDPVVPDATQRDIKDLPDEVLLYLLGSRYCDTDRLGDFAWATFSQTEPGWSRVQAICDFVHNHLQFDYQRADSLRTAHGGFNDKVGVCRDFAHLAITLCRCMNIPARYCTGYLGDIGIPPVDDPMDFSAWFEAYLNERWFTFDARHNVPRNWAHPNGDESGRNGCRSIHQLRSGTPSPLRGYHRRGVLKQLGSRRKLGNPDASIDAETNGKC